MDTSCEAPPGQGRRHTSDDNMAAITTRFSPFFHSKRSDFLPFAHLGTLGRKPAAATRKMSSSLPPVFPDVRMSPPPRQGYMNESDNRRGRYSLLWSTGGEPSVDLLHYALPHHQVCYRRCETAMYAATTPVDQS